MVDRFRVQRVDFFRQLSEDILLRVGQIPHPYAARRARLAPMKPRLPIATPNGYFKAWPRYRTNEVTRSSGYSGKQVARLRCRVVI